MKLTEFFAEIFFKTNPLPLKDLIKNIGELNARTILAGVGLDGIYVKLKQITDQSIATALSLNLFGKSTNLPIEGSQRFANAVAQLGGNAQDAMNDLAQLQERLIKIKKLGTPDAGINQALYWLNNKGGAGIKSLGTDPITLIDKMRNAFQRLDKETQVLMLSQLGLSQSSALYLRMTDAQWEAQKKNASMLLEQINLLADMNKEWVTLTQNITQAGAALATSLSPELAEMGRQLNSIITSDFFKKMWPYISGQFIYKGALTGANAILMTAQDPKKAFANYGQSVKQLMAADYMAAANSGLALRQTAQENNIHIHTDSSDPNKIAKAVSDELERMHKTAAYQDGGKRL